MERTVNLSLQRASSPPTVLPILRRVRKWGDPIMVQWGFDVNQVGTTNFQAVRTWNDGNRTWGGVTNFLRIPHWEVLALRDLQFDEQTDAGFFTKDSKMNWLFNPEGGTIYFPENTGDEWKTASQIRWGTVSLGGNLVQVEKYEIIEMSIKGEPKQPYEMARLVGFTPSDWQRPLNELLSLGLVHRCYCVYKNNQFGDTPKGIIYSPFFSPTAYDFTGTAQPTALYSTTIWLE